MTRIDGRTWPSRRVTRTGDSDRRAHLAVEAVADFPDLAEAALAQLQELHKVLGEEGRSC